MPKRKRPPTQPPPPPETSLVPTHPGQLQPPEVLVGELLPRTQEAVDPLRAFLDACENERSRATLRGRLDHAARFLLPGTTAETFPWPALDHVAVQRVVSHLTVTDEFTGEPRKASPATVNLTRAALRLMARVLFKLRLMSVDERQRVDDVRPARGKREAAGRALDHQELRKLFRACGRDAENEARPARRTAGVRDAALLAVLFGGGLRRDEASKLNVGDFDAAAGELRVQGKGNVEKPQPIGPEVVTALEAWLVVRGEVRGQEAMFLVVDKVGRVQGRRLRGAAIAWTVDKRARQAGIEPVGRGRRRHLVSPHDLRRSFGTLLLERGEDLGTVAKAMRHASVTTTAIYDRRDRHVVAEAVAKLHVPLGR